MIFPPVKTLDGRIRIFCPTRRKKISRRRFSGSGGCGKDWRD
jgi:hypothetical protein